MDYGIFHDKVKRFSPRLQKDVSIKGFQADAVFGNIGHECAGFTKMQEVQPIAGRGGYGWLQWTGPRRVQFEAWCTINNLDPASDEANYGFLKHELLSSENASLVALRAARTRDDAVRVFEAKNERAGVAAIDDRILWAERAEAARLEAEKESNMDQQASVIVPHLPAVPDVPTTGEGLAAALSQLHQKVEGLMPHLMPAATASATLGTRGSGMSLGSIFLHAGLTLVQQYNVPARLAGYVKGVDVGTPVAGAAGWAANMLPTAGIVGVTMMPFRGILQNPNLAAAINGELQKLDIEKVLNNGVAALAAHASGGTGTALDLQPNRPA